MKKIAKNSLFFIILFLFLTVSGKILNFDFMAKNDLSHGKTDVYAKLKSEPKNSLDVIVIGDSESYTTFSPMLMWKKYGFTSYSAGQPGAKISDIKEVVNASLKYHHPKVILFETNALFRHEIPKNKAESTIAHCLYKPFPVMKEHNSWKSLILGRREKNYMGFTINAKVRPYYGGDYMKPTTKVAIIDENNIKVLSQIKKKCDKNGVELVLYSAPSPKNYNYKKYNALKQLADKEKIKYFDMNTDVSVSIDWLKDTRDKGDHLNYEGAKKTTMYIGEYLRMNYNLPDRRNEKLAGNWNKLLKVYDKHGKKASKKIDDYVRKSEDEELYFGFRRH